MKNKTPIQEAIEQITQLSDNENVTGFTKRAYASCLDTLTELLEKEKQSYIEFGNTCAIRQTLYIDKIDKMTGTELVEELKIPILTIGEELYNEKFNNK